tara:strand:+ start:532 stop:756 length:225 start_codon:yes stop_codon:yes gene_type:complete
MGILLTAVVCIEPIGSVTLSGRLRIGLRTISGRVDILPYWGYHKVHNHMALLSKFFFLFRMHDALIEEKLTYFA